MQTVNQIQEWVRSKAKKEVQNDTEKPTEEMSQKREDDVSSL